jgi:hypothetical protein
MLSDVAETFFGAVDKGYPLIAKDCALKGIGKTAEIAGAVFYLASLGR